MLSNPYRISLKEGCSFLLVTMLTYLFRESQWTHIQNTAAKKTLLLGRIKMYVMNALCIMEYICKSYNPEIDIHNCLLVFLSPQGNPQLVHVSEQTP